jgi:hypothetical protein
VLERERVEIPCIMIDETRERETYPDCMSDLASTRSWSIRTTSTATAWNSGRPVGGARGSLFSTHARLGAGTERARQGKRERTQGTCTL